MMTKLGGRCVVQKSLLSSNLGVIASLVAHPKNVAFGYDVRKISAGCLVFHMYVVLCFIVMVLSTSADSCLEMTHNELSPTHSLTHLIHGISVAGAFAGAKKFLSSCLVTGMRRYPAER